MKTKTAVRLTSLCLCICIMLLLAPQVYAAQTEIVSIVTKLTTQTVDRSTGGSLALNSSLVGSDSSGKRYAVKVIWKNDEYRSYKDGTFIFSAEPVDSNYIFSSECIPQVTVINKINGDFDSNVSRKYYFDHTNDFLDFSCYYTENDFSGAAGYYDIRLSQKSISDYWTLNNGKIVSTISRTTENVWNGLNRASCVSSVILNSLKLYNFRLEVDYQHAADWWYPYVLFGVQDPTRFFGKLYISPYGNLTTGDGTDLAFDRSTLAGGVYAYLEQEGVINVYGAVDDDGYGRLYFDKDISADKQVLATYNLKLVAGGLLESISAGIAPDVYLFGSEADPVNFASRGALVNLSDFDDYETVSKRFSEGAIVPFRYSGGSYALPVTQTFLMMYVREDVFEELGFEIPKTWEEVYRLLPFLQQNNMEFGFPVPSNANVYSLALILFQNQRELYRDGGKTVMLDTDEALDAFESWTKLYTDYSCIVDYNFVNRFRIGDIPIGIADFTVYNTLQVSAPEINGMWNMYPVPSSNNTDGCGYSVSAVSSAFILNQSERPDEAWEFLKWFTDEEEQYDYAMAIENLQGASARFSTANLAAFNRLSFKKSTLQQINVQRDKAVGVQQVPGGYFLSRHIDNIYRAVKNDGDDVRQTVLEYTDVINEELTRKRKEFGLETAK